MDEQTNERPGWQKAFPTQPPARRAIGSDAAPSRPDFARPQGRPEGKLRRAWRRDWVFLIALVGAVLAIYGATRIDTKNYQPFKDFVAANMIPPSWLDFKSHIRPKLDKLEVLPGVAQTVPKAEPTGAIPMVLAGLFLFAIGCVSQPASAVGLRPGGLIRGGGTRADRHKWLRRFFGFLLFVGGGALCAWALYDTYWDATRGPARFGVTGPNGLDGPAALYGSVILLVAGAAWMETRRRSWFADLGFAPGRTGVPWWKGDAFWLLLFMIAWFLVNVNHLDTRFGFFTGDESSAARIGRGVYIPTPGTTSYANPWGYGYDANICCFPRGWLYMHGGDRPLFYPRLYTLVVSTVLMGVFFVLARALVGRAAAWVALALFSTSHAVLYFARVGLTNADAVLAICLYVLVFHAAWRTRRLSLGLFAGLLMGLTHYFYRGAMIVIPLTALVILLTLIRSPRTVWRRWALLAVMAIGLVLTSAPDKLALHDGGTNGAWRQANVFLLTKINMDSKFAETETTTLPRMLASYSWPAFGGMLLWPHGGQEWDYASNKLPLLGKNLSILHLLGLVGLIVLWRRRMAFLLVGGWWLMLMIVGSLLTINAPYIPRILSIYACGGIMAGWVLTSLAARARRLFGVAVAAPVMLAGLGFVGFIAYTNTHHYYFEYITNNNNRGYLEFPTAIADFVRKFPKDAHMVYWTPADWSSFGSSAMELADTGISRQEFNTPEPPPPPDAKKTTVYVVSVPAFAEIDKQLAAMFPDVKPEELSNKFRPDLPAQYKVYRVKPGTTGASAPATPAPPAPQTPLTAPGNLPTTPTMPVAVP